MTQSRWFWGTGFDRDSSVGGLDGPYDSEEAAMEAAQEAGWIDHPFFICFPICFPKESVDAGTSD